MLAFIINFFNEHNFEGNNSTSEEVLRGHHLVRPINFESLLFLSLPCSICSITCQGLSLLPPKFLSRLFLTHCHCGTSFFSYLTISLITGLFNSYFPPLKFTPCSSSRYMLTITVLTHSL